MTRREPLTHFICLPLGSATLEDRYAVFAERIRGLAHPLTIRPPTVFHLTIGCMCLNNETKNQNAIKRLMLSKKDIEKITENKPIQIKLQGLSSFQSNLQKLRIIYANPSENAVLLTLSRMKMQISLKFKNIF